MKKTKANLIFLLMTGLFLTTAPVPKAQAQVAVSFQFFYDKLSPYGSWVSYPQYGYVWVPAAGPGFRPYLSNGHWVLTDDGWMWASYYDWGWAPFHYGSWVMDPEFGWAWVPGYDWAPAWVAWGDYNGYYGWAPIQPGFSISIASYHPPIDYWCFMSPHYMTAAHYNDHFYVAHNRRIALGSNTTVINNVTNITVVNNVTNRNNSSFNAGPRRVDFENTAKVKVQPVSIRETTKPGRISEEGNAVTVYRPRVAKESVAAEKPRKVASAEEVKRTNTNALPNDNNIRKEKITPNNLPARSGEVKDQPQKVPNSMPPTRDANHDKQVTSPRQIQERPARNERPQVEPGPRQEKQPSGEVKPIQREKAPQVSPPPQQPEPKQAVQPRRQPMQQNERSNQRQTEHPQPPKQETAPRDNGPHRK